MSNPFVHIVSTTQLNGTGEYYIGVQLLRNLTKHSDRLLKYSLRMWEVSCKLWDDEEKLYSSQGCTVGPKTTFNSTHCICNIRSAAYSENDTMATTTTTEVPKTLKRRSTRKITRATFAGSFFVAPNPIDFSVVFGGDLSENYLVFTVILIIFGIYLFLLVWARREDRKDVARVTTHFSFILHEVCFY